MTTANRTHSAHVPGRKIVILIALFKLLKGTLLTVAAAGALALTKPAVNDVIRQWVIALDVGPFGRTIGDWVVNSVLGMHVNRLKAVAVGAGLYATLFYTEGAGLIFDKIWAEWMVVVTSAGLIPFEIAEIVRRRSPVAVAVLVLNVTIVVYLYFRVRERMRQSRGLNPTQTPPAPPPPDAGSYAPDKSERRSEASASAPQ
jgi:uncharacterized membrane protein (DUF2068 family)